MRKRIDFPSPAFDEAVAAVCHGTVSRDQAGALNSLLRHHGLARDEYLFRVELHARLGSHPDLFAMESGDQHLVSVASSNRRRSTSNRKLLWAGAAAAGLAILAAADGWWRSQDPPANSKPRITSTAVAMLGRVADAQWAAGSKDLVPGAPLDPGWLRLESGLAQVVFYSGARIVLQGPAELQLVSTNEASCHGGRLTAEVPPQARGFRLHTPQATIEDLGTSFGLVVEKLRAEVHVFQGHVALRAASSADEPGRELPEGSGAVVDRAGFARTIAASPEAFAALFDLQIRARDAQAMRYDAWRVRAQELDRDPSLLVHLNFEKDAASEDWRLPNAADPAGGAPDATIVGCQWTSGRWPRKQALEFQSVSDRVRVSVPGAFVALTLAAWVRVQGLDREINSLFMSDGFAPGTLHWLLRDDGVLGLTVIGERPGDFQIVASPPVLQLNQFGMWIHLAVVLDGDARRAAHYLNGDQVSEEKLQLSPPFRVNAAELGNWNPRGFPGKDSFLIRNFSGAMDEFTLFARALNADEIRSLHTVGQPQSETAIPKSTIRENK